MTEPSMNADFKLDEAEARRMSPLFWPAPKGKIFDAWWAAQSRMSFCARAGRYARCGARQASQPASMHLKARTISP